jgi:gliding motility-associated lipoprotein GldD
MLKKKTPLFAIGLWIICLLFTSSCSQEDAYVPKPYAYFRIDFPTKKYTLFNDSCPFEFEYPANYAVVMKDSDLLTEPCWKNIIYPNYKAEINFSYKEITPKQPLDQYLKDSWTLATKHQIKASAMPETVIKRDSANVHGLLFEIQGNSACNIQFYLTDSTRHFVRGSLYFFCRPNYDSLAPVIGFIKQDIERMISSFRWKTTHRPPVNNR